MIPRDQDPPTTILMPWDEGYVFRAIFAPSRWERFKEWLSSLL